MLSAGYWHAAEINLQGRQSSQVVERVWEDIFDVVPLQVEVLKGIEVVECISSHSFDRVWIECADWSDDIDFYIQAYSVCKVDKTENTVVLTSAM